MHRVHIALLCLATVMGGRESCFADLFATLSDEQGIVHIDFDSKQVVEVYSIDDLLFPNLPLSGLTFDGTNIYLGQTIGGAESLISPLNVPTGEWQPPIFVDPIVGPNGEPLRITGLGHQISTTEPSRLVAILRQPVNTPISYLVSFEFDPLGGMISGLPVPVPLASFDVATGADVDPVSGAVWVTARGIGSAPTTQSLSRVDLDGNELLRLTLDFDGILARGLAFDDGRMFVAGRNFPESSNQILELDPATGAIIDSFTIPAQYTGIISGLAGGTIVPEPSTMVMTGIVAVSVLMQQQRQVTRRRK